jgi:hypothetical protein
LLTFLSVVVNDTRFAKMEQPSTESVDENVGTDKETTNVTRAALESDEYVKVHESVGHNVKTQLKVTGGQTSMEWIMYKELTKG